MCGQGVRERLDALAGQLRIHVVTGDTFGHAAALLAADIVVKGSMHSTSY